MTTPSPYEIREAVQLLGDLKMDYEGLEIDPPDNNRPTVHALVLSIDILQSVLLAQNEMPEKREPKLFSTPRADSQGFMSPGYLNRKSDDKDRHPFLKQELVNDAHECEGFNSCHDLFMPEIIKRDMEITRLREALRIILRDCADAYFVADKAKEALGGEA
jgi:hypothetical protein